MVCLWQVFCRFGGLQRTEQSARRRRSATACSEDYCCNVDQSAALTCGPSQRAIPRSEASASTSEKLASHRPTDAEFAYSFAW